MNDNKSIRDFLEEHVEVRPVSFHMPGHKGSNIYRENGYGSFLENIMDCDITEIPGADNLFQTESIILAAMEKYRELYDCRKSYLLINGSSTGIIAGILSSVSKGGKLVMARNCHKSAFNALSLGDITPVYAFADVIEDYGILGAVTPQEIARCLDENPEAEAVILPSPNYYGICSDIEAIAEEVHSRGKVLIVDQAHGAHLKFFGGREIVISGGENDGEDGEKVGGENFAANGMSFPRGAEELGADIVINSTHKTLASFTQTAVLNICSDRVDLLTLEDKLQVLESSSPSYPLMATLDINADLLLQKGEELMADWASNLEWFYKKAAEIKGLSLMTCEQLDPTKLNLDMSACGLNGNELEDYLMTKGIFIELVAGNLVMGMSGIGNKRSDFERLIEALCELSEVKLGFEYHSEDKGNGASRGPIKEKMGMLASAAEEAVPQAKEQPAALTRRLKWAGVPAKKEAVHVDKAAGRVCAMSIIPYPPGIPIACPGEVLDEEILQYIKERKFAGEKVIGLSEEFLVQVGVNI